MPMWSNLKSLKILSCLDIEVKYSQNFYFFFAIVEEVSLWDPGETRRGREWKHCLVLLEFLLGIKETVCQEPTTKTHKSSSYCIHSHSKINHLYKYKWVCLVVPSFVPTYRTDSSNNFFYIFFSLYVSNSFVFFHFLIFANHVVSKIWNPTSNFKKFPDRFLWLYPMRPPLLFSNNTLEEEKEIFPFDICHLSN